MNTGARNQRGGRKPTGFEDWGLKEEMTQELLNKA